MNIEIYRLILETFTALGTVGAVCISLWVVLRTSETFIIKDAEVWNDVKLDENHKISESRHFLYATLENKRDVPMQVFEIGVSADYKKNETNKSRAIKFPLKSNYIPPKSIYKVKTELFPKFEFGEFRNAEWISIYVGTSFGDKEYSLNKKWNDRLFDALEMQNEVEK